MAIGVVFGVYLVMIGAGVVVAGISGLIRERRAIRRVLAAARPAIDPRGPEAAA
jgi:hypothetical protein